MYKNLYQSWINSQDLDQKEREELLEIKDNDSEIEYRFGKDLDFGTAGMRGIIGLGTNMMNVYNVKRATQGLSEYIKTLGESAKSVALSYLMTQESFLMNLRLQVRWCFALTA